jgi:hypothetical protein
MPTSTALRAFAVAQICAAIVDHDTTNSHLLLVRLNRSFAGAVTDIHWRHPPVSAQKL